MSIRRKNLAFRYLWTAWLNLVRWAALGGLVVFLTIALVTKDSSWFLHVGIAGGVFMMSLVFYLFEASAVRCLGCGGTLLRTMRCAKHRTAKRLLGSYTLHCTLVLATYAKSVHCPYCGMRYRISRHTRLDRRKEHEEAEERIRTDDAAKEEKARQKSEAKNVPYY